MTHLALGQRRLTSCLIHLAPSAVTTSMRASLARELVEEQVEHVLAVPSCAQMRQPRSWSTTTVTYLWPFCTTSRRCRCGARRRTSRRRARPPARRRRACTRRPRCATRRGRARRPPRRCSGPPATPPSSKSRVKRAPCRAQGTASVRTPCSGSAPCRRVLQVAGRARQVHRPPHLGAPRFAMS